MIWIYLPILIAAVTLILQIVIGFINSRQVARVYDYLIKDARQRSRRSFTIVVKLSRRAETITPLLDHLREFNYTKLQVVVVVKQTAGSRAKRSLESYRRRTGMKLTIVKHRRGLTDTMVVARYATGEYVMQIDAADRLSYRFFDLVSQILFSTQVGALAIRNHLRPRQTFLQAAGSLTYLFNGIGQVLGLNRKKYRQHVLIKRKLLTSGKEISPRPYLAEQVHIDVSIGETQPRLSFVYMMLAVAVGALLLAVYYIIGRFAGPYESGLYGIVVLATVAVCAITLMTSLRGYKLVDYVNMILFVPLLPIYAANRLLRSLGLRTRQSQRHNYRNRILPDDSNIH